MGAAILSRTGDGLITCVRALIFALKNYYFQYIYLEHYKREVPISAESLAVGETSLLLGTLAAVGHDVGALAAGSSEVASGFSGLVGSQKERVTT